MKKSEEINIGTSCLNRSQADEPLFVLCARDPIAAKVVRSWASEYVRAKGGRKKMTDKQKAKFAEAQKLADQMDDWALAHGFIDRFGKPLK